MVELRVVDILGFDVIFDMDQVVSEGDLGKVIAYTPKVFELCRVAYARSLMCMCVQFQDEIHLRGEECKIRENFNFLKKGKMVISAKIRNFYRSQMMKRTSSLE